MTKYTFERPIETTADASFKPRTVPDQMRRADHLGTGKNEHLVISVFNDTSFVNLGGPYFTNRFVNSNLEERKRRETAFAWSLQNMSSTINNRKVFPICVSLCALTRLEVKTLVNKLDPPGYKAGNKTNSVNNCNTRSKNHNTKKSDVV